jgi:hypothetical protein
MRAEGVQHGTFYTVRESGYLHDFEGGVSACWKRQLHYIISGGDCLEFLAPGWARDFAIRVVKAPT